MIVWNKTQHYNLYNMYKIIKHGKNDETEASSDNVRKLLVKTNNNNDRQLTLKATLWG